MVKIVKYLASLVFCLFMNLSYGQVTIVNNLKIDQQLIIKNASVDTTKISGFRIQLAFNTDRSFVENIKIKYTNYYPESKETYTIYQQPYWKLRVGNFYREIDALATLKQIREFFPNAFIVPDNIKRPLIEKIKKG
ncbi:MAG: SPOR domain-containing protein [Bacteroidia bacterium]|nr:SPOR domain-containing protein [Bacteroidia bacterium]|tara:strand:- start:16156 stop:16563 length:408 start_codon:yes stop_codon:yes gene_type:complete